MLAEEFPRRKELVFVVALCVAAALRVFLFSAAFPFFNNVDEEAHLDLILKVASGHLPKALEPFENETIDLIMSNRSPEYAQGIPAGDEFNRTVFQRKYWIEGRNHEATSPPVYYAVAAIWYRVGKIMGLSGGEVLYWIRFLNIPISAGLVWLAWSFGRIAFPASWHLRVGAPLIVACWPQDVFYSINSDVLSPLFAELVLLFLFRLYLEQSRRPILCVITGLLIAASCLTKLSNLPLCAAPLIVMAAKVRRGGQPARAVYQLLLVVASAIVPIVLWSARNVLTVGDVTATSLKTSHLGWSLKPFGAIWSHPIFRPDGLITFWHDLMGTFWRGEFFWHGHRLAVPEVDAFYSISSAAFIGLAAASLVLGRPKSVDLRDTVVALSLILVFLSVAMLAVLSIIFDFGSAAYPSTEYPYLTSGRLISAVFLPFVMLYLIGLNFALRKAHVQRERVVFGVAATVALIAAISEIYLSWGVFRSPYNWFHI